MKALSVQQPWATLIAEGLKTIETRGWLTRYRGPLLICSTKTLPRYKDMILGDIFPSFDLPAHLQPLQLKDLPRGMALAKTTLQDCRAMTLCDEKAAMCEYYNGACAWLLEDIKKLPGPFPVSGKLGLFEVEIELPKTKAEGWLY